MAAGKLRLRPILMTSLAFILGVFPLVVSTGAGASSRHEIGTGVIGGMLFAAFLGLLLIPVFYVSVRMLLGDKLDEVSVKLPHHGDDATDAPVCSARGRAGLGAAQLYASRRPSVPATGHNARATAPPGCVRRAAVPGPTRRSRSAHARRKRSAFAVASVMQLSLTRRSGFLCSGTASALKSRHPLPISMARPAIAQGVSTAETSASANRRPNPSSLRSSSAMGPISSVSPSRWTRLTAGYAHPDPRIHAASGDASSRGSQYADVHGVS